MAMKIKRNLTTRPTAADIARWRSAALMVFDRESRVNQFDRAVDLARDVLRVLDPDGYGDGSVRRRDRPHRRPLP